MDPVKLSIRSSPENIKIRIKVLEDELKTTKADRISYDYDFEWKNRIKKELNTLYKLRYKQKNYTEPPNKTKMKGL